MTREELIYIGACSIYAAGGRTYKAALREASELYVAMGQKQDAPPEVASREVKMWLSRQQSVFGECEIHAVPPIGTLEGAFIVNREDKWAQLRKLVKPGECVEVVIRRA